MEALCRNDGKLLIYKLHLLLNDELMPLASLEESV
jgi:hypothetical protein